MLEADLKERLERELGRLQEKQELITYRDLAVRLDMSGVHKIHRLTGLLEQTMREDHAAGCPIRAASVVSRTSGNLPQRGFFQLLHELGRYNGSDDGVDARVAHRHELDRLWSVGPSEQKGTRR